MTNLLLKLFVKDYQSTEKEEVRKRYGLLGSYYGLITNFLLFLAKIVIGVLMRMYSIVADSVNNLSDFGNNFLSIFGFKISAKAADTDHPFGHQRMEYVISLIISCVIIALGVVMGYQGTLDLIAFSKSMMDTGKPVIDTTFLASDGSQDKVKLIVTLVILVSAVLIKITQSLLYRSLGKKINSMQLIALSKDSRNDVISTSLVIVGVVITWLTGYNVDCFFTIAVAVLVIISGVGIMKEAVEILLGQAPDKTLIEKMIKMIKSHPGVLGMHDLTMHYYGNVIYAVIHVEVDASKPVMESHEMIDEIEREVYGGLNIALTIHMDPILVNDPDTEKYKKVVEEALEAYPCQISMHDFRIVSAKSYVNLVFDLVIPTEQNNDAGREKIRKAIHDYTNYKFGKETFLVVSFDDTLQDFLAGTEVEKKF